MKIFLDTRFQRAHVMVKSDITPLVPGQEKVTCALKQVPSENQKERRKEYEEGNKIENK